MSDRLCKWLNEDVQVSQAIGKYVQSPVEMSARLMLTPISLTTKYGSVNNLI